MKQETMRWQWHQLYNMQITCTLLETDNHAITHFLQAGCCSRHLTNSVKTLKATRHTKTYQLMS